MRVLAETEDGHVHWCPACEINHIVPNRWDFNGNIDKPTFAPSVRQSFGPPDDRTVCHYHIVDGVIDFADDCTHSMRGKHPLPELTEDRW